MLKSRDTAFWKGGKSTLSLNLSPPAGRLRFPSHYKMIFSAALIVCRCFVLVGEKWFLWHVSAHSGSHLAPSLAGRAAAATKTTLSCLISCQEHKTHFSKGLHVTFSPFSSSSKDRFKKSSSSSPTCHHAASKHDQNRSGGPLSILTAYNANVSIRLVWFAFNVCQVYASHQLCYRSVEDGGKNCTFTVIHQQNSNKLAVKLYD